MCRLFDVHDDGEDVVRHGSQGAIVADQIGMTMFQKRVQLRVICVVRSLATLNQTRRSTFSHSQRFFSLVVR